MTLATRAPSQSAVKEKVIDHFILHGVSWDFYDAVLRELGDRHVFVTYDRGELEFMAPSNPHEGYKKVIGRMIEAATEELGLPLRSAGSMTMRREDLDRGLEPDECYYVQHEAEMREFRELDLSKDPPPDLVVEMDYSYRKLDREGIYAALGVPEVWRFDLTTLEFLSLAGGRYENAETSTVLGGLPRSEVERFVRMGGSRPENDVIREWRQWLRAWVRK